VQTESNQNNYLIPFILVTSLFFLWAFVHQLEPILIPHLKKACQLNDLQSALIDSSVYLAYFIMALPAGYIMKKIGYRKGIIFGLLLYVLGAFLFIPAANTRMYPLFLSALFIVAAGCAVLETIANPYITILGNPDTATTRLNFSQSFNGLGAFIAPIVGGQIILSGVELTEAQKAQMTAQEMSQYLQTEADAVKLPYIIIGFSVLLVAILFMLVKMPEASQKKQSHHKTNFLHVFRHQHLKWGVIALFFYVGAQVGTISFFIRFAKYTADIPEKQAALWLGYAMFGFMVSRFLGTYLTRFVSAHRLLMIYALIAAVLLSIALVSSSYLAVGMVFLIPLLLSIMFPTIFALAITNLKEDTEAGSSMLVMAIVGGAVFPLIMGWISDQSNIQVAYIIPLLCFLVVAWYGWKGYKVSN
jgi:MFS transporter, FHS family, L-fucose permease